VGGFGRIKLRVGVTHLLRGISSVSLCVNYIYRKFSSHLRHEKINPVCVLFVSCIGVGGVS
jgi:uncharacterized membrane protein